MAAIPDGLEFWLSHPVVQKMGWVLVHFVWQGALVAGVLAVGFALLRPERARLRYALSLAALVTVLVLPAATWFALPGASPAPTGPTPPDAFPVDVTLMLSETVSGTQPSTWGEAARSGLTAGLPWIVAGWLAGVGVLALRLLGGWGYTMRLRRVHAGPVAPAWEQRAGALAARLGVRKPVPIRQSAHIDVPMVIGWMRPVVLVPVSVFTGLPPEQVEALIAHELAHIRRHDVLVGRLQAVAETLLFYHPAVWWISRQVRVEREHCCDDLVVQTFHDRVGYARALTTLAAHRVRPSMGTVAATDGTLLTRIRRLVGRVPEEGGMRSSVSIGLLGVAVGLMALGVQLDAPAADDGGVQRAVFGSWLPSKAALMHKGEARARGMDPALQDTVERDDGPPHPRVLWFQSDSTRDFTFVAPGALDSLGGRTDVFIERHLAGLDTIPLPPIPDVPLVMPFDSLPAVGVAPNAPFVGVWPDTLRFDALRDKLDSLRIVLPRVRASLDSLDWARIDSLRREAREQWQAHREDVRRLVRERRKEAERLHRRMREEHPERLREQAERLRRQAERLEEEARRLENEHGEPEAAPKEDDNGANE